MNLSSVLKFQLIFIQMLKFGVSLDCYECTNCPVFPNNVSIKVSHCEKAIKCFVSYPNPIREGGRGNISRGCGDGVQGDTKVKNAYCNWNLCNKPLTCKTTPKRNQTVEEYAVCETDQFVCHVEFNTTGDILKAECDNCPVPKDIPQKCVECDQNVCNRNIYCAECDNCADFNATQRMNFKSCPFSLTKRYGVVGKIDQMCSSFQSTPLLLWHRRCGSCDDARIEFAIKKQSIQDCVECNRNYCNTISRWTNCFENGHRENLNFGMSYKVKCAKACIMYYFENYVERIIRTCGSCSNETILQDLARVPNTTKLGNCLECYTDGCNNGSVRRGETTKEKVKLNTLPYYRFVASVATSRVDSLSFVATDKHLLAIIVNIALIFYYFS